MGARRIIGYLFLTLYAVAAALAVVVEFVPMLPVAQCAERESLGGPVANRHCDVCDTTEVELLFVGDVMAHLPQVEAARVGHERYDFGPHFEPVVSLFGKADFVVANLETTLSPRPPYSGYPSFATPEELARDLARAGVDFVTIANNHIADQGSRGVLATIAALDNAHIGHCGASVGALNQGTTGAVVVEIGGLRIALLAYTYGLNAAVPDDMEVAIITPERVADDIARLPKDVDLTVALLHWGNEYQRTPSSLQLQTSDWMRSLGVDLIVGSHPHVVQPYAEWLDESGCCVGGVYYSLGNFISNQNDPHTDYGLAARVLVRKAPNAIPELTLRADTLYRHRRLIDGRQHFCVSPTR